MTGRMPGLAVPSRISDYIACGNRNQIARPGQHTPDGVFLY